MPFQALRLQLGSDDPGDVGLADQGPALEDLTRADLLAGRSA